MGENGFCASEKSAQDLLTEFQLTGQEAPFAEIARRYAGMVYNVALRVTHDAHDAEDATQATFLTLAVHAKTAGKIRYLGPWLKKVSHRLALDLRRSKKRRTAREQRHALGNGSATNGNGHDLPVSGTLHVEELRNVLREEIDKLPAKYRMPLILYYFGGLTPEQIGDELRCNTSTLGVRLHRGRKMLADSLTTRGVSINAAIAAATLGGLIDSVVKDNIVRATTSSAIHAGGPAFFAGGGIPGDAMHLMRIAMSALKSANLKGVVAAIVMMASTFAGGRELLRRVDPSVLQHFNPLKLLQPLMDKMLRGPRLSVQADAPTEKTESLASIEFPVISGPIDSSVTIAAPIARINDIHVAPAPLAVVSASPLVDAAISPQPVASARGAVPEYQIPAPESSPAPVRENSSAPLAVASSSASKTSTASPEFVPSAPRPSLVVDHQSGNIPSSGGPSGEFKLPNTTTRLQQLVVGDQTSGKVVQDSGTLQIAEQLTIAKNRGSTGIYELNGPAVIQAPKITIGAAGSGTFIQNDGTVTVTTPDHQGQLTLGEQPKSRGVYELNNGTLEADNIAVGLKGEGEIKQNGGTVGVTVATLGVEPGATGTWSASPLSVIQTMVPLDPTVAASLTDTSQSPAAPPKPRIVVGDGGTGNLNIHSSDSAATVIRESSQTKGSSLVIRSVASGKGTFRGAGTVELTGPLVQNGRVIADGDGSHKVLDLSAASRISNTIENRPNDGTNGWYAENLGALLLPKTKITSSKYYTWGEDNLDDTIDLVNSVRFRPHITGSAANAQIMLLDPDDPEVPSLPDGREPIGLWSFDGSSNIKSVDLIVRYDDQFAAALNVVPRKLELWGYDDEWVQVEDASVNSRLDLITGTLGGRFTYFAAAGLPVEAKPKALQAMMTMTSLQFAPLSGGVSVPEPGTTALTLLAAGGLLSRRKRRANF